MMDAQTTGLTIREEKTPHEFQLRLKGSFNRRTAMELKRAIGQLSGAAIILDFSQVEEFQDLAVAILVEGLEDRDVRVVGLPRHCERVFNCFGWRSARA